MRHAVLGLVSLLAVSFQEEEQEVDVGAELAALIARTNALESFHVVYEVEDAAGVAMGSGRIELSYQAPDIGRLAMATESTQQEVFYSDEGVFAFDQAIGWSRWSVPETPRSREILFELFPGKQQALGPGRSFSLRLQETNDEEQLSIYLGASFSGRGRRAVLNWLSDWETHAGEVTVEGEALVREAPLYSIRLSRKTGFPEEIRFTRKQQDGVLRLIEARLDEPLEEQLRVIPEEARKAEAEELIQAAFEDPRYTRHNAFHHVDHQIEEGLREWNGATRNDWSAFLDAFHREALEERYSDWRVELEKNTTERAEWVRARRGEDPSEDRQAELEQYVADSRTMLEELLLGARDKHLGSLTTLDCRHGQPAEELFEVEQEVVEELWAELLSEPVLASFDEELEAALGR